MMNALEVVHGLEKAGFSRQQAEAISEAVEKATLDPLARLATRDDVADVRTETTSLRMELKAEIAALHAELKAEIAAVRTELKEEIAAVRTELKEEIAAVRAELHKEIGGLAWKAAGLLLAQAAFIIAVIKLLP
jgi:hypothetical protein